MIKYHDNTTGAQYGEDHMLTDNWDASIDYKNEHVHVYFRIDTPSYDRNGLSFTPEDRDAWHKEISELISSFGIIEDSGYTVEHSEDKRPYLYAHPQTISGVILKNDIKRIAEAIDQMKLSSIRWVDLYETVYVISDEEYGKYLESKREEIANMLFKKSATKRTTKYYAAFDVARDIADSVRLNRLGYNDGKNYSGGPTVDYILKVADEMIKEGYLKSFEKDGSRYIRSLNKTEQHQLVKGEIKI